MQTHSQTLFAKCGGNRDGGMEYYGSASIPIYSGPIFDGKLVVETAESYKGQAAKYSDYYRLE